MLLVSKWTLAGQGNSFCHPFQLYMTHSLQTEIENTANWHELTFCKNEAAIVDITELYSNWNRCTRMKSCCWMFYDTGWGGSRQAFQSGQNVSRTRRQYERRLRKSPGGKRKFVVVIIITMIMMMMMMMMMIIKIKKRIMLPLTECIYCHSFFCFFPNNDKLGKWTSVLIAKK